MDIGQQHLRSSRLMPFRSKTSAPSKRNSNTVSIGQIHSYKFHTMRVKLYRKAFRKRGLSFVQMTSYVVQIHSVEMQMLRKEELDLKIYGPSLHPVLLW